MKINASQFSIETFNIRTKFSKDKYWETFFYSLGLLSQIISISRLVKNFSQFFSHLFVLFVIGNKWNSH